MIIAIIGEIGIPFDMKKTSLFGLALGKDHKKDYRQVAKVGTGVQQFALKC